MKAASPKSTAASAALASGTQSGLAVTKHKAADHGPIALFPAAKTSPARVAPTAKSQRACFCKTEIGFALILDHKVTKKKKNVMLVFLDNHNSCFARACNCETIFSLINIVG